MSSIDLMGWTVRLRPSWLLPAKDGAGAMRALEWSARAGLAFFFLWDGFSRYVLGWHGTVDMIRARALPTPESIAALSGALEIVGAIALMIPAAEALAAILLAIYCLGAVTLIHPSFSMGASIHVIPVPAVAKDLVLVGGLVMLALRPRDA